MSAPTASDAVRFIDRFQAEFMERPHMYAPTAESLENLCWFLEHVREYLISGNSPWEGHRHGYSNYLEATMPTTVSSPARRGRPRRLTESELANFRRFCDAWKAYCKSSFRMQPRTAKRKRRDTTKRRKS